MAEQRVLFLGDSLTASKYWKDISLPEAVVAGKGFPGQPIGSVMKQGATLLQQFKPTDVVLQAGVNNLVLSKPKTVIMQDLLVAWKQVHDAGAKVWAVKLTPWFGYRMFDDEKFANYATDATRAVNDWMSSMIGQEGGPDYVIDTSGLGDARGHLLGKYSHDKLHLNGKGYKKLAEIVQAALLAKTKVVAVGQDPKDMPPAIKYVVDKYTDILKRRDIPPANVTWGKNEVTFWYWTQFRAETAKDSVGTGTKYGAEMIYVRHKVIEEPKVESGGAPVNLLQEAIEGYVDQLKAKDIPPAKVEYQDGTITFWFYTKFRADTAAETLPSQYKIAGKITHLRMAVLEDDAKVGQVPALNQETPYTCGPAALRAVLRHYGKEVSEDDAATAVANVPVLGARPHGMVRGAQELGFHAVASYFRDTKALLPFVTHDVPVIVIVDSFLKPGKQGHYVVVTNMDDRLVTIMDPHLEGNWRKLPLQEFDARWWHKREDANGEMEVARRLAIVVVPETVEPEVEAGEEKVAPVHGRIARCKQTGGIHKWGRKIIQGATKALVTIFSGGTAAKLYDKAMDAMYNSVQKLDVKKQHDWFNDAPNEDVYLWAVGYLKRCSDKAYGDKSNRGKSMQEVMKALGIEPDSYSGERDRVSDAAFKLLLWHSNLKFSLSPCIAEHALQAILILDYGPLTETWPIVEGPLKKKPSDTDAKKLAPWANAILEALDDYRVKKGTTVAAVGGEYPPGVEGTVIELIERLSRLGLIPLRVSAAQLEEPDGFVDAVMFDFATQEQADRAADMLPESIQGATKKVAVKTRVVDLKQDAARKRTRTPTIRQKRLLDDARESDDVQVVLKAYFLARKLGLDEVAETLGKRHQALVEKTMPDEEETPVSAGAKKNVEASVSPEVEWIFQVEYLKQVWPLIEGNRADKGTLREALKTAMALEKNYAFLNEADSADRSFVSHALAELIANVSGE